MAMVRSDSHLNISAPPPSPTRTAPPSPIPTATGSRSAADQILSEYIDKSIKVPELTLPDPHFLVTTRHNHIPEVINLRSLVSREAESIDRLLKSASEFGAFRIKAHGISGEELRSLVREAKRVFGILEGRDTGRRRDFGRRSGNKEEIVWVRSGMERLEWARECIGAELFESFSEKMEKVGRRLDGIAEQLGRVFVEHLGKQFGKRTQERQSVLSIYKYNIDNTNDQGSPSPSPRERHNSCGQALSLHLPAKDCKYWMQSPQAPFYFNAGPDEIIVTVEKQLEEWSVGDFKCTPGEIIYLPTDRQAAFSIHLKCSSLHLKQCFNRTLKTISIEDQLLFALVIALLYSIFNFLWS